MQTELAEVVTTRSMNAKLREIAAQELAELPQHLEKLTPAERVRFLLAILPYTAPKVETCTVGYGDW